MVRRRSIRGELIRALDQGLSMNSPQGFRVSDLKGLSRGAYADFTKLKYWNLIEHGYAERWRVTMLGADFLGGFVSIPKYVWIFNNIIHPAPPGEPNPEISVYDIKDHGIDLPSVRRHSISVAEYIARKNGDLYARKD